MICPRCGMLGVCDDCDDRLVLIRSSCACFVLQEVLHGALFNAAIQLLQPALTELTSVHEAGHVTVAYLAGCPISTYTLGKHCQASSSTRFLVHCRYHAISILTLPLYRIVTSEVYWWGCCALRKPGDSR